MDGFSLQSQKTIRSGLEDLRSQALRVNGHLVYPPHRRQHQMNRFAAILTDIWTRLNGMIFTSNVQAIVNVPSNTPPIIASDQFSHQTFPKAFQPDLASDQIYTRDYYSLPL